MCRPRRLDQPQRMASCWFDSAYRGFSIGADSSIIPSNSTRTRSGIWDSSRSLRIGLSYGQAQLVHRSPELSLEDFLVNRFGDRLYRTFFKDYTEKVWGVPCREISAEWGAQRIKGLSVRKAVANALASPFRSAADTRQKQTETSLIERFLYPQLGPGQMWEAVARKIAARGGAIHLHHRIIGVEHRGAAVTAVKVRDELDGSVRRVPCDHFISTMPYATSSGISSPRIRR